MSESASTDATKSFNKKVPKGPSWNRSFATPKDQIPCWPRAMCFCSNFENELLDCLNWNEFSVGESTRDHVKKPTRFVPCAVLIHQLQLSDQGWSLHYVVTTVRSAQAALEQAENKIRLLRISSRSRQSYFATSGLIFGPLLREQVLRSMRLELNLSLMQCVMKRFGMIWKGYISGRLLPIWKEALEVMVGWASKFLGFPQPFGICSP